MTSIEQQILGIIQDGFPISERPYAVLAEKLGGSWTEQSVFDAVERLRASGIIRRIGGVYDSRKLGFVSRLCAGVVPTNELDFCEPREGRVPTALENFAEVVNAVPAITHNYIRSHHYNVWFTVIAESEEAVQAVVDKVKSETALQDVHVLASKRMFKINTVMKSAAPTVGSRQLKVDSDAYTPGVSQSTTDSLTPRTSNIEARRATSYLTTESDKLRVRLLSGDIPHTLTPFTDLCGLCGCGLDEFLDGAREDLAARRMRRFGAVLRHQAAGFACNAMVCCLVDSRKFEVGSELDGVAEAGTVLAANPHVSHCYERAPFDGFPYNLYAMFHATSAGELENAIAESVQSLAQFAGGQSPDFAVLHSVRELKKTSFSFFGA